MILKTDLYYIIIETTGNDSQFQNQSKLFLNMNFNKCGER